MKNPGWLLFTFAYAEGYDAEDQRHLGLRTSNVFSFTANESGLVVKSEVAQAQIAAEIEAAYFMATSAVCLAMSRR